MVLMIMMAMVFCRVFGNGGNDAILVLIFGARILAVRFLHPCYRMAILMMVMMMMVVVMVVSMVIDHDDNGVPLSGSVIMMIVVLMFSYPGPCQLQLVAAQEGAQRQPGKITINHRKNLFV